MVYTIPFRQTAGARILKYAVTTSTAFQINLLSSISHFTVHVIKQANT